VFYELYVLIMVIIIKIISSDVLNMDNIITLLRNNLCFIQCNLYLLFLLKVKKYQKVMLNF
jgi:hypothetical protein